VGRERFERLHMPVNVSSHRPPIGIRSAQMGDGHQSSTSERCAVPRVRESSQTTAARNGTKVVTLIRARKRPQRRAQPAQDAASRRIPCVHERDICQREEQGPSTRIMNVRDQKR